MQSPSAGYIAIFYLHLVSFQTQALILLRILEKAKRRGLKVENTASSMQENRNTQAELIGELMNTLEILAPLSSHVDPRRSFLLRGQD